MAKGFTAARLGEHEWVALGTIKNDPFALRGVSTDRDGRRIVATDRHVLLAAMSDRVGAFGAEGIREPRTGAPVDGTFPKVDSVIPDAAALAGCAAFTIAETAEAIAVCEAAGKLYAKGETARYLVKIGEGAYDGALLAIVLRGARFSAVTVYVRDARSPLFAIVEGDAAARVAPSRLAVLMPVVRRPEGAAPIFDLVALGLASEAAPITDANVTAARNARAAAVNAEAVA